MKRSFVSWIAFITIGLLIAFGAAQPTPLHPSLKTAAMATKPPHLERYDASISAVIVTPTPTPIPTIQPTPQPTTAPQTTYSEIPNSSHTDWMAEAGIAQSDWQYVEYIMLKESGGRPDAINSSSGACGLFQQLPCGKWAHTWNDPVGAMIDATGYATARYGGWAGAYSFWLSHHYW